MKKVKRNKHWHNNGSTMKIRNKRPHNSYNEHHAEECVRNLRIYLTMCKSECAVMKQMEVTV
jgi:hypothetical protein